MTVLLLKMGAVWLLLHQDEKSLCRHSLRLPAFVLQPLCKLCRVEAAAEMVPGTDGSR